MPSYRLFKRLSDVAITVTLLSCLLPVLLCVVVVLKLASPGPVFYRQARVGYQQKPFDLLKFRTMTVNMERDLGKELDPSDPEITPVGRYLRRFKIDELPQLINVLLGQMSLVGPRPPLPLLLADMSNEDKGRFDVLPGLTGLAQVNGNIHLSWQQRFKYDLEYVRAMSLGLDVRILLKTVLIVLLGEEKFVDGGDGK